MVCHNKITQTSFPLPLNDSAGEDGEGMSDGLRAKYGKVENRGLMTVLYQVETIKEEL